MTIAYSGHFAYNYLNENVPWERLHELMMAPDMHWINHHAAKGHRAEENMIPGFDMLVLDVDGTMQLDMVHDLMARWKFLTYTTKRHTPDENRFRLIMPINYRLNMDSNEYKELINGVLAWLPFVSDESTNQRCKKWMTCDKGYHHYNDGELFDILPFIPKTSRNEAH
ncbi:hypothetical protein, partial [Streptomyces sp. P17]|uniref:hypothetical protein n=1 Tax=Streptomyces sp. P17 TaxID=3074716 RepID=UPI0028F3F025